MVYLSKKEKKTPYGLTVFKITLPYGTCKVFVSQSIGYYDFNYK